MAAIEWSSRLALGHPDIDTQHRKLVDLINKLDAAIKAGKGAQAATEAMSELRLYTIKHFRDEERLQAAAGYPEMSGHKAFHAEFVARVQQFEADCQAGRLGVAHAAMTYLSDWLAKHILKEDRKLVTFLNAKRAIPV
ncbi:MAG: bacteriohemerythrin [Burkholderiales bacterium]